MAVRRATVGEGYDLEVRHEARAGEPITVGYVEIGSDWAEQFADANFLNQRLVPDVDTNGQPLDSGQMKQAFYLEPSAGGTSSSWLRLRIGGLRATGSTFRGTGATRGAAAST